MPPDYVFFINLLLSENIGYQLAAKNTSVIKEILGESKGRRVPLRDGGGVRKFRNTTTIKRSCLQNYITQEKFLKYITTKKGVQETFSMIEYKSHVNFYNKLDIKGGENDISESLKIEKRQRFK